MYEVYYDFAVHSSWAWEMFKIIGMLVGAGLIAWIVFSIMEKDLAKGTPRRRVGTVMKWVLLANIAIFLCVIPPERSQDYQYYRNAYDTGQLYMIEGPLQSEPSKERFWVQDVRFLYLPGISMTFTGYKQFVNRVPAGKDVRVYFTRDTRGYEWAVLRIEVKE
jgi:hypothetical protein